MLKRRSVRRYERRRVIVNTRDGAVYSGFLEHALRDCIVLRATELRRPADGGPPTVPVDGEVILLREALGIIQVVGE